MFGKNISSTPQTVNGALALVLLATCCWASVDFACHDFKDSNQPKHFSWDSGWFLPFADSCQVGGASWVLLDRATATDLRLVSQTELDCCCYPDIEDWNCTQGLFLNRLTFLFPMNVSFFSSTSSRCGLEGRLKPLRTLLKVYFEKSKPTGNSG